MAPSQQHLSKPSSYWQRWAFRSSCWNLLPNGKDELTRSVQKASTNNSGISWAPTNNSGTFAPTFCTLTPAPAVTPGSAQAPSKRYSTVLKGLPRGLDPAFIGSKSSYQIFEQFLNTWFPDLHVRKFHKDCYHFVNSVKTILTQLGLPTPNLFHSLVSPRDYQLPINLVQAMYPSS